MRCRPPKHFDSLTISMTCLCVEGMASRRARREPRDSRFSPRLLQSPADRSGEARRAKATRGQERRERTGRIASHDGKQEIHAVASRPCDLSIERSPHSRSRPIWPPPSCPARRRRRFVSAPRRFTRCPRHPRPSRVPHPHPHPQMPTSMPTLTRNFTRVAAVEARAGRLRQLDTPNMRLTSPMQRLVPILPIIHDRATWLLRKRPRQGSPRGSSRRSS